MYLYWEIFLGFVNQHDMAASKRETRPVKRPTMVLIYTKQTPDREHCKYVCAKREERQICLSMQVLFLTASDLLTLCLTFG